MKKFIYLIFLLTLVMALPTVAEAAEENRVAVNDNMTYDPDEHMYVYSVTGDGIYEVMSNVADGLLTNGPVVIRHDAVTNVKVFRDGEEVDSSEFEALTKPGAYVVNASLNGNSNRILGFTIIGASSSISEYKLPMNFSVESMTLNDAAIDFDPYEIYFDYEGDYMLTFCCGAAHTMHDVFITIDKTPPTLALVNVKNGEAKGPVSLADAEPGADLYIEFNNIAIMPVETLTTTGTYYVKITDEAGNSSEYKFDIVVAINSSTVWFIVIFVILLIGITVYLVMSRKKMRIR